MSNRRFEMHQYRQILARMRMGDTDRSISRAGLKTGVGPREVIEFWYIIVKLAL